MATLRGPVWANYHKLNINSDASRGIQAGLDARRSIIFFRRLQGGQITPFGVGLAPDVNQQPEIEAWRDRQGTQRKIEISPNTSEHGKFGVPTGAIIEDYVAIIDVDANDSSIGYNVIKLQTIPRELEWNTESTFAVIKPIGRNTPFYHYTGGEVKLQFEIDWYATTSDNGEVIRNCRRVESLSKADGYTGSPHRVLLKWGSNGALFDGIYFQVISAPYKLTRFNKAVMGTGNVITRTHMLPVQAYQTVTLVRVDEKNLSKNDIEFVSPNVNTG